ncbi:oxidoreductase [Paenibacillus sambharensis]|uniref:Oxidoreductase n=1 Tax=Paenibacillus sambharensis TaxID=1803190 RepID=A0A2W1LZL0_9BACL|nr:SDR family oxidoreductase [Paenibacillus sambharensis]PZD97131.1 oxidoreductase [Paenibacillus sambharensis]
MITLKNKIAVVTGVSRSTGIGTAICRSLASFGADIFFTHWSAFDAKEGNGLDPGWPEALKRELETIGVRAFHMEADLAKVESPSLIMDQAEQKLGTPAILINNATFESPANYKMLDALTLDNHYAVNVRGTILLTAEFARRFETNMPQGTVGRVIFMLSGGPDPNNLAYITTKSALTGIVEPLSVGLAHLNITVNGFNPGPTDSGWMNEDMKQHFLGMFPMGRIGTPQDAARGVALLVSDESQWITGQVIKSEGGFLGR